jgi:hypothetical protein
MIFIAGVSPKIKVLDQNPRRCPVCGLNQAYYKRPHLDRISPGSRMKAQTSADLAARRWIRISNTVRTVGSAGEWLIR